MRNRNAYIDVVKGIAIILVVLGHTIQFGSKFHEHPAYFENPVFMLIYSFHMPLFMMISGYLFYHSVCRHPLKHNLKTRITHLFVPVFAWSMVYLMLNNAYLYWMGKPVSIMEQILHYQDAIWFLWAIFWCSMAVLAIRNLFKDHPMAYILTGCCFLFIPDILQSSLYSYMYFYFIAGYLWNKYQMPGKFNTLKTSKKIIGGLACLLLFAILYSQYGLQDYIYTTGNGLLDKHLNWRTQQLQIDLFRYSIGFAGALTCLFLIKAGMRSAQDRLGKATMALLKNVGRKTLGIYIINGYINLIQLHLPGKENYGYGMIILQTIIITLLSYLITTLLEHNKITRQIFLGA